MGKRILLIIAAILVIIQFIRPERNLHPGTQTASIGRAYPVPAPVQGILEKACYDCHSNNTRYPWYSNIQPVGWWLERHVNEGKRGLNFDEFAGYTHRRQSKKMKEAAEQVEKGEMPLDSYTWIHKDAVLTAQERSTLIAWAHDVQRLAADSTKPDTD
ncbi:heme-binding domain-containing protein [Flaviaesturariibacter aridisoli]|uniref:Cytochrome C n=1 Tax=Flaviaesturariibacter aridisoli TaxID=2545761 RepID=A0A4R4E634_9BACT|nr:heme-binding domain-containing protein [Flaviaesturariibacter aridisoli]TCZ73501.1 cytochrome C [Flaviaesturariibacter aridisoli]